MKNFNLRTERTLTVEVFTYRKSMYVRTREVAQLLGIKQPFEFTANIKQYLGANTILKGEKTKAFRTPEDEDRTTFINIKDLYYYLSCCPMHHKFIKEKRDEMCRELCGLIFSGR